MTPDLVRVIQEFVEIQTSTLGRDLDREETCQELWVFVLPLLAKVNTRKNPHSYILTALRHQISKIRRTKYREITGFGLGLENIPDSKVQNMTLFEELN